MVRFVLQLSVKSELLQLGLTCLLLDFISFHYSIYCTAQHQQADDFGRWGAHAGGVICYLGYWEDT